MWQLRVISFLCAPGACYRNQFDSSLFLEKNNQFRIQICACSIIDYMHVPMFSRANKPHIYTGEDMHTLVSRLWCVARASHLTWCIPEKAEPNCNSQQSCYVQRNRRCLVANTPVLPEMIFVWNGALCLYAKVQTWEPGTARTSRVERGKQESIPKTETRMAFLILGPRSEVLTS